MLRWPLPSSTTEHTRSNELKEYLDARGVPVRTRMIFPCIDLMDGKVVQLVQGREKALEGDSPEEMLRGSPPFRKFRSSISMPPWAAAQ